jgi:peptide alpha-N-acetyltransferase
MNALHFSDVNALTKQPFYTIVTYQVMYKAKIMFDDKKYEEALAYLAEHEVQICDERALRQMQANLLVEMNELSRAEALYRRMLDENRENHNLYAGLERCLGMTDATPEADRLAVYTEYRTKFPKAHAPQLLPLFFTTGATFEKLLDEYLRFAIRKGMCPMFRNIRQVYSDPAKVGIVEKLANSYLASLTAGNKFDAAGEVQPPTCFVWASYFAAQHFDKTGDHVKAMEVIDAAIAHTPTVLELYMAKAKILKHAGNLTDAAHWLNYARELDTADRYINSKSVKYMLRANEVDKAATTVALFTREATDPMEHLSEMQAFWFETEQAKAFARMGNVGKALKKIKTIEGHFSQMVEDQFDFHTYCIRKMTLRAYHGLMNMEDNIRGHRFYVSAAVVGIDCYLGLHDKPYGSKEREESEAASAGMTPAERKKMLSKQKKAAKKAAADAAAASAAKDGKGKKAVVKSEDDEDKKVKADEDPMGELLMKTTEPLEEALKLLKPLMLLAPNRIESHLAAFEVYVRKGKVLLMLRSLKRAQKIDPNHPDVHRAQVQCLVKSKELAATTHPKVQAVLDAELPAVLSGVMDAEKLISAYSAANPKSLPALLAVAEMTALVTPAKMGDAAAGLAVADLAALDGVTLPVCRAVHACLAQKFKDAAGATKFLASSKVQFSLATW